MTVITIHEENHGLISIAIDYISAIKFLLENHWLDDDTKIYDEEQDGWVSLVDTYGNNWRNLAFNHWDIDTFNEIFEGLLYLNEVIVYE